MHKTRRCIVVQALLWCNSRAPLTLQVVPCSTSARGSTAPWNLDIPSGTSGFDVPGIVAYTSIVQPVLKQDVVTFYGHVGPEVLGQLRERIAQVFDLIAIDDEQIEQAERLEPT